MKFHYNRKVQIVFLYIALVGTIGRAWVIPTITWQQQVLMFGLSMVWFNGIWLIHYNINELLNKYLPFEKNFQWRLIAQLLGGWTIVKTLMLCLGIMFIDRILPAVALSINRLNIVTISTVAFLSNVVISLGFIARQLFQRWQENELRAFRLEKEKTQVQYDNLKNQLNPHFLFNSLSSLDSLIEDNPGLARQFLRQLSRIFRYVLQHKDKGVVSVETELSFITNYVSLLKTRFDGALSVVFSIDDEVMDLGIVPVTLQVLIENAIKHNIINEAYPLTISIRAADDFLTVENRLQRKSRVETSNGEGLTNLKNLYSFLSPVPVVITDDGEWFSVKIPLLIIGVENKVTVTL